MDLKLIAVDLDGTLLHTDETLSQSNVDALKLWQDKGAKIVIATSRSLPSSRKLIDTLHADAVVYAGGARAVIGDDLVYEALFLPEQSTDIIQRCLKEPSVNYLRVNGENNDWSNNPGLADGSLEFGHYRKTDFFNIPAQRTYKFTICSQNLPRLKTLFKHEPDYDLTPSYAGDDLHKLTHAKASKEAALTQLISCFGLTWNNVLSFGNDGSDCGMLCLSGCGVAVGNATADAKAASDAVCASNDEDGVAAYLLEHI